MEVETALWLIAATWNLVADNLWSRAWDYVVPLTIFLA